MSAFGVSQRLGVEMDEAGSFIETYYAQFPKVRDSHGSGGKSQDRRFHDDDVWSTPLLARAKFVKLSFAVAGRTHGAQRADSRKRRRYHQAGDD